MRQIVSGSTLVNKVDITQLDHTVHNSYVLVEKDSNGLKFYVAKIVNNSALWKWVPLMGTGGVLMGKEIYYHSSTIKSLITNALKPNSNSKNRVYQITDIEELVDIFDIEYGKR